MNQLPKYLYANGDGVGAGVIIHTEQPLIVGRVILYDDYWQMSEILKTKPPLAFSALPGFSIAIIFGGILGENRLRLTGPDDLNLVQAIINTMAAVYYRDRVEKHKARFKRYLI